MVRAGRVGVSQFIDQNDSRASSEHGVEVHFLQDDSAILDPAARHLFESVDQGGGLGPAMRLDETDDDVHALVAQALSFLQHLERLADAGGEAEVDLEPAPLLLANQRQEILRRGPIVRTHVAPSSLAPRAPASGERGARLAAW